MTAACISAFVAAACSLAVDTSGLSSGGPSAPDASDANSVDAPADGAIAPDGPADARPDAPPARPCDVPHTICEDFDDPSGARSLQPILDNGGQLIDDDDHVSAPRSVICRTAPSGSGNESSARMRADFVGLPSRVHAAFDMKTANLPLSGFFELLKLETPNSFEGPSIGYGDAGISIAAADSKWSVYRFGHLSATDNFDERNPLPKLGDGEWHHVELDSKLARNGGNLTVTVDGSKVVDAQGIRTLTEGATGLRLVIGLYTNGVGSAWDVKLDNVVADAD